jgi:hypothetical protein
MFGDSCAAGRGLPGKDVGGRQPVRKNLSIQQSVGHLAQALEDVRLHSPDGTFGDAQFGGNVCGLAAIHDERPERLPGLRLKIGRDYLE